jgi:hypothetical protein
MPRRLTVAVVVSLAAIASGRGASAQAPPTPVLRITCLQISGDIRTGAIPQLKRQGRITLVAPRGCLVAGQVVVVAVGASRFRLGRGAALEDGSISITGTVPPQIEPGTHNLLISVGGKTRAVRAVQVVAALGSARPAATRTPTPASSSTTVALVALGIAAAALIIGVYGWRRSRRRGRPPRRRLFRRSDSTEVPAVDTTDFVPRTPAPTPTDRPED